MNDIEQDARHAVDEFYRNRTVRLTGNAEHQAAVLERFHELLAGDSAVTSPANA